MLYALSASNDRNVLDYDIRVYIPGLHTLPSGPNANITNSHFKKLPRAKFLSLPNIEMKFKSGYVANAIVEYGGLTSEPVILGILPESAINYGSTLHMKVSQITNTKDFTFDGDDFKVCVTRDDNGNKKYVTRKELRLLYHDSSDNNFSQYASNDYENFFRRFRRIDNNTSALNAKIDTHTKDTSQHLSYTKTGGLNLSNVAKLTLNSACFGSKLPTNGSEGQLFFLIEE